MRKEARLPHAEAKRIPRRTEIFHNGFGRESANPVARRATHLRPRSTDPVFASILPGFAVKNGLARKVRLPPAVNNRLSEFELFLKRNTDMRWQFMIAMVLLLAGLAGCEQSPMADQADQVRDATQREADKIRDESQRKAQEVRDKANYDSSKNESKADSIERQGERTADQIEAEGERIADEMEAVDSYWRDRYRTRPYYKEGDEYAKYRDAYVFGYTARLRHQDKQWDDVVAQLQRDWERVKADARMTWAEAQAAIRDAWDADYPKR